MLYNYLVFLFFLLNFISFDLVHASNSSSVVSPVFKTSYYVACLPENCCCGKICSCDCDYCEQKPCFEWDNVKRRFGVGLYSVEEQSGRKNEKRVCSCSCQKTHVSCVNCAATTRNSIGEFYDWVRHCRNDSEGVSCDACGCCIRKIELGAPMHQEPIH